MLAAALLALLPVPQPAPHPWEAEVVYQIFPRSFRDSDGDGIGDLRGIEEALPYLADLGVTALLINPIVRSRTYHNYFADDFFAIDPEFGTDDDLLSFVAAAHRRRMKVVLDMEPQYVTGAHPWFADPAKVRKEGSAFYGLNLRWYDGAKVEIAAINPDNSAVRDEIARVFRHFAAFGFDGFRIDHMMDDLDAKGVHRGMLKTFWRPVLDAVPGKFVVGEQADWGLGADLYRDGGVDAVFGFALWGAIRSFDRAQIEATARLVAAATPPGRTQVNFLENHDTERYATAVGSDAARLRLGAALGLCLKGTPAIYYGQELGMRGRQGKWNTDGNDIPVRLPFRWGRKLSAPGTTDWIRKNGPWSRTGFSKDDDGLSVEEQAGDPNSLLSFYRRLIALRKASPALSSGSQAFLDSGHPKVLAVVRESGPERLLFLANLGKEPATVDLAGLAGSRDRWTGRPARDAARLAPGAFRLLETPVDG